MATLVLDLFLMMMEIEVLLEDEEWFFVIDEFVDDFGLEVGIEYFIVIDGVEFIVGFLDEEFEVVMDLELFMGDDLLEDINSDGLWSDCEL